MVSACTRSHGTIPEITPHLDEQPLQDTADPDDPAGIAAHAGKLIRVSTSGSIRKLDPDHFKRLMTAQVTENLRPEIRSGDGALLLTTSAAPAEWIVFDMETFKEISRLPAADPASVAALSRGILVTREKDTLTVHSLGKGLEKRETAVSQQEFRSCGIADKRVVVLTRTELMQMEPPAYTPKKSLLPHPAAGGFLIHKGFLYYGSENRLLVKLSLRSAKAAWAAPLPRVLSQPPVAAGGLIAVLPRDQYIHFFTPGGGLAWWSPLEGTRLYPPLKLTDNIAVFLYPAEKPVVRFFNWKKREAITHGTTIPPSGSPLAVEGKIFYLARIKDKLQVHTLTNRRGIDIRVEPEFPRVTGRSLEFKFSPVNLIRPEITLSLLRGEEKNPVITETLPEMDNPAKAWLPGKPGNYTLKVEARSRDGCKVESRIQFRVHDLAELTRKNVSAIQAACQADRVAGGDPAR